MRELSAGGLVYRRTADGVVVCLGARRRQDDAGLVWSIPKGHVEAGERMTDTAVREVREETGLDAAVEGTLGDVTYWYVRRDEAGQRVRVSKRVRFFLLAYRGGRFADRDRELDDVRWIPLDEAADRVPYVNEREILRRARAVLAGSGGE